MDFNQFPHHADDSFHQRDDESPKSETTDTSQLQTIQGAVALIQWAIVLYALQLLAFFVFLNARRYFSSEMPLTEWPLFDPFVITVSTIALVRAGLLMTKGARYGSSFESVALLGLLRALATAIDFYAVVVKGAEWYLSPTILIASGIFSFFAFMIELTILNEAGEYLRHLGRGPYGEHSWREGSREDLARLARYQKALLAWFAGQVALYFVVAVPLAISLANGDEFATVAIEISLQASGLLTMCALFALALKCYSPASAFLLTVVSSFPCISLIVILIVNRRATTIIEDRGIKVGLFGAKLSAPRTRSLPDKIELD